MQPAHSPVAGGATAHTTNAQVSVPDGPLAGNGILGVVTAPHRGSWPLTPAAEVELGTQTLWLGSNTFWSANTYGADGNAGPWPRPTAVFPHCEVSSRSHVTAHKHGMHPVCGRRPLQRLAPMHTAAGRVLLLLLHQLL